ncbi:hypothetical protein [Pseudomonas sp. Teo4]|uniref:hypothetical protein n=1 Tax=Pseudomonas sp. Teo4 TaxID=3064528 RepID=UPI002ACB16F5|nr:hypothetical protein [Pseudomonas sp. Teo4]
MRQAVGQNPHSRRLKITPTILKQLTSQFLPHFGTLDTTSQTICDRACPIPISIFNLVAHCRTPVALLPTGENQAVIGIDEANGLAR